MLMTCQTCRSLKYSCFPCILRTSFPFHSIYFRNKALISCLNTWVRHITRKIRQNWQEFSLVTISFDQEVHFFQQLLDNCSTKCLFVYLFCNIIYKLIWFKLISSGDLKRDPQSGLYCSINYFLFSFFFLHSRPHDWLKLNAKVRRESKNRAVTFCWRPECHF